MLVEAGSYIEAKIKHWRANRLSAVFHRGFRLRSCSELPFHEHGC